jgi:SAM-dependent methyltransferase
MHALARWRIRNEFAKRGPWVSQFRIDGRVFGGDLVYENDRRVREFFEAFPDARAILEPGCLEGALSFQLAERPGTHVTAIDSREANLERARYVQTLRGAANVAFVRADLERTPLASFGSFDAIFCSGLLYHLPRPWEFLDGVRATSRSLFLWTHYAWGDEIRDERGGYRGFVYQEKGLADPRSGMSDRSFFMQLPDIVERLRANGFTRIEIVDDRPSHKPHACVTLAAEAPE